MSNNSTAATENNDNAALLARIQTLEADLKKAKDSDWYYREVAKILSEKNLFLVEENEALRNRNHKLQNPDERDNGSLSWLGKIVLLLRRVNRPMQKSEIEKELQEIEKQPVRPHRWYPDSLISVVLHKGAKSGRLKHYKIPGTKGGYYALKEWVDKDGNLIPEMEQQIL